MNIIKHEASVVLTYVRTILTCIYMASFSREPKVVDTAIDYAVARVGLRELKPEQREVIRSFASGKDVFVALPTGYGKSYCFALLPFVFDFLRAGDSHVCNSSIVVCVSPLTALMMEQREKFSMKGVSAEFVGELQQDLEAMRGVKQGKFQLLYISPESLLRNPQWREMLLSEVYQKNVMALVVDEAHCITQW